MGEKGDIRVVVRAAAKQKVLFLPHAVRQILRPDRAISTFEVRQVIASGQVIEEYPEDPRGHSCLLLGRGVGNRPIHVVCAPKEDYLAIITAYLPGAGAWSKDFRARAKK
ncbi:MAG: DUF4258 domain-containing protein [Planctomycetes bacterium]|nr:DUF4258 domain-containing protein [Planctomycetota bacterium]